MDYPEFMLFIQSVPEMILLHVLYLKSTEIFTQEMGHYALTENPALSYSEAEIWNVDPQKI